MRNWCVKPEDDVYGSSTKIVGGVNRALEIDNIPKSLIKPDFIASLCSFMFIENEPPVGLIEGDTANTDKIKILTEEEGLN